MRSMYQLLAKFILSLISGELFALWKAHKLQEALDAQNKVASLSDTDLDKRVLSKITRN